MAAASALAACGVGSAARAQHGQVRSAGLPLATAAAAQGGSWAVVRMAGSGGAQDRFWQLLVRAAAGGHWRLATPPGVADSGGLAVTGVPGGTLTAGFVPSELLKFTPLAISSDSGATWSPGLLSASLAAEPGALAALPGGRLLAITARSAEVSSAGAASWTTLVTLRSLAASPAGRACGLIRLTAAAASPAAPAGAPILAGACGRPGEIGVFTRAAGGWQAAGPALPGSLAGQRIAVLRLTDTGTGVSALLAAGTGRREALIPAWLAGQRTAWTLGRPYDLNGSQVESASVGAGGQWGLVLSGRRGAILGGPGASWQMPPALPSATAVLLPGTREVTALAPGDSAVTVWQLTSGSGWRRIQVIGIPVISGSSS
jgi:hypothetical protein